MEDINLKKQGIQRVLKFSKKKSDNKSEFITEKEEFIKVEADTNVSIVKIEYTLTSCILLLSDGRVLSRGKTNDPTLGREYNSDTTKKFKEVNFLDDNIKEGVEVVIFNISAGDEHVLALDSEMRVWGWGKNNLRQINPNYIKDEIKKPSIVMIPNDLKVIQLFALNSSSMIIGTNNFIYMWGSNKEKFLSMSKAKQSDNPSEKFIKMDKLSSFISNDIKKNDYSYLELYVNSRKLFNTNYNVALEDNLNKAYRIDKLNLQIQSLKNEIKNKSQLSNFINSNKSMKHSDLKINILQELLNNYENKLSEIANKKESLRKELIEIEDEINKKNLDLKNNTNEIDAVEDKIEQINNEINLLKPQLKSEKSQEIYMSMVDKQNQISNSNVYKESLTSNLHIIIVFIESKDKERYEKASKVSELINEENELLKGKYVIEDMITILQESYINENCINDNVNFEENKEKINDRYIEYFRISEKLDNCTFIKINRKVPYKIVPDILEKSEKDVHLLSLEYEALKSTLSDSYLDSISIIISMINSKIDLIKEQNSLIKCLYLIFNNLEDEIKKKSVEMEKDLILSSINSEDKTKHVEYIYKDLIILYLKEVYRYDELDQVMPSTDELEKMKLEMNSYIQEKQDEMKRLDARKDLVPQENDIDFDNLVCFNYESKEDESKGLLSFLDKFMN